MEKPRLGDKVRIGEWWEQRAKEAKAEAYEELTPLIDDLFNLVEHADFSNGIVAEGCDEGSVRAGEMIQKLVHRYKQLKSGKSPKES